MDFPIRSISLPSKFQSSCFENDFVKIQSDAIRTGFTRLSELYNSIEELIRSPLTQQALRSQNHTQVLEEALDVSVGLLDACTGARDLILMLKEKVEDLQSALRRRGADSITKSSICSYITFRKKTKKEISKLLKALNRLESNSIAKATFIPYGDYRFSMVVKALRESSGITKSCLESLLLFFSVPVSKTRVEGLFLFSRKEQRCLNEIGIVDMAVESLYRRIRTCDGKIDVQVEVRRLETLDDKIKGFELGLDCLFRSLIRHRVSLLNIMTP